MEVNLQVQTVHLIIEKGDEMQKYVENLSEINMRRDRAHMAPLYTCAKEERVDTIRGITYSLLAVYKMGLDTTQLNRPVKFQEVVPVDKDGNIIQETHQTVKQASVVFNSLQIENFQKKRGMRLKAATMNAHAGRFNFGLQNGVGE